MVPLPTSSLFAKLISTYRNQNALGGSIPRDTFQDAVALEDLFSEQEDESWREWPLLASDGDCAALIQLVSENKVCKNIVQTLP